MIKLRPNNMEKIEKIHLRNCKEIILQNRNKSIPVLEEIIFRKDGLDELLMNKIIIGKRVEYFNKTNRLFILVEFYNKINEIHKIKIKTELCKIGKSASVLNKREFYKMKLEDFFGFVEEYSQVVDLFNNYHSTKKKVLKLADRVSCKKDIYEIIKEINNNLKVSKNDMFESMANIFNYDNFCSNRGWNRRMLLAELGVNVCPYCNRQYITNCIDEKMIHLTTADIDHFYAKSIFPYLGLSLYNMVPSCQICNSRLKMQEDFYRKPRIYPYEESFGSAAKFIIDNDTDIKVVLGSDCEIDLKLDIDDFSELRDEIISSNETFKLEMIYKQHQKMVKELILKNSYYSDSKIEEVDKWLKDLQLDIGKDKIKEMIFSNCNDHRKFDQKPLSKLTYDILEYLERK